MCAWSMVCDGWRRCWITTPARRIWCCSGRRLAGIPDRNISRRLDVAAHALLQCIVSRKFRRVGSLLINIGSGMRNGLFSRMLAGSLQQASGKSLGRNGVGCVIVPCLGVGRMGWHGKAGQ